MYHLILRVSLLAVLFMRLVDSSAMAADELTPKQLFEKRLMPIFKSPNPSSCVECHFSNVELKQYILPSHEQTFVSLRDQGLIDLEKPEESKILKFIKMGEEAQNRGGRALVSPEVRRAEYEAFSAWIKASVGDQQLREAPKLKTTELARPKRPVEVIRYGRKDRLLDAFENSIWAERHRCMSCHVEGTPENKKFIGEFGEQVAWIKADGAEATMRYLMSSKLIDLKNPEKSALLLKPLGVIEHKGGKKFLPGDLGYKAFRGWIEDYARIVKDQYPTAASLPKDFDETERFTSGIWLKITNTPPTWGDRLLQAEVHAWDAEKKAWETVPVAVSDRLVNANGKLWQHTLTLIAANDSPRLAQWTQGQASLPSGKYLIKLYVDMKGKVVRDWKAPLGAGEYVGQIETEAAWRTGYGSMSTVDANGLKK